MNIHMLTGTICSNILLPFWSGQEQALVNVPQIRTMLHVKVLPRHCLFNNMLVMAGYGLLYYLGKEVDGCQNLQRYKDEREIAKGSGFLTTSCSALSQWPH